MNDTGVVGLSSPRARAQRYLRSPKGLLIVVLVSLTAIAALGNGPRVIAPGLFAAILAAIVIDGPILRWRKGRWTFPDGALLTGLIVAMILSPQAPWHVAALASALGVGLKYVLRGRTANIFNPAALALLAAYFVFHSGQSWWGALPELSPSTLEPAAMTALLATGLIVADRVHRLPAALVFLGVYFSLFTLTAFFGDADNVSALYRASDLHAVIFLAFFMITDPPTSPARDRDQFIFGVIAAASSYAIYEWVGAVYFLVAGLLVANAWEAWRRHRAHALRHRD